MATVVAPARSDRAFERLYRRHVADVYRYVLAVLQNEADAEDATQSAFLAAYRAYERGERPERPLNWLIKIAHNVCRERWRESARRPRVVALEDELPARANEEESPKADEIRRALGFLAFNQRAALVMRELQGRSYDEIAAILGLSTSAVETLLFRARRALREQLEGGLSCGEAELALSKRADGQLGIVERGRLRAHLRECAECAALERRQRFRRAALRSIGTVPLPSSLGSLFGGGAAGTSIGVGAKAAAVVVAGVVGSGISGDAIQDRHAALERAAGAAPAEAAQATAATRTSSPAGRPERGSARAVDGVQVLLRSGRRQRAAATRRPSRFGATPPTIVADAPTTVTSPGQPPADAPATPATDDAPAATDAPAAASVPPAAPPARSSPASDSPAPALPPAPEPRPPAPPSVERVEPPVPPPGAPPTPVAPVPDPPALDASVPKRPTPERPPPEHPKPDRAVPELPDVREIPLPPLELPEKARAELEKLGVELPLPKTQQP